MACHLTLIPIISHAYIETEHVGRCWKDWEELGRIESNGKGLCRVASFDRGPMFHKELKGQMMMKKDIATVFAICNP